MYTKRTIFEKVEKIEEDENNEVLTIDCSLDYEAITVEVCRCRETYSTNGL